jgi:glycosyltransferase involved in cell wall biosynthesis
LIALSIIIPSYNRLWALPKAIESCRTTKSAHEIIVIDDGSTDGTSDWLAQQPDIVHVRTDNWGKDWAVNKALSMARGQYVRFLDSDDWLEPDANDAQLEIALKEDADVVVAGYRTVDERTGGWVEAPWVNCDDFIAQQLGEGQDEESHYSAFLFRKSFIQDVPHRQEFLANDDRMFILEVALKHPRIAASKEFAMVHRHHDRGRLQVPAPADLVPIHMAELGIYKKIYRMLADRGEMNARRGRASTARRLWPLAHQIARYDLVEATRVYDWICELEPEFKVPGSGFRSKLYNTLGFRTAAIVLRIWRFFMWPLNKMGIGLGQ